MSILDYLIIGHITRDLTPTGTFKVGGTVAYTGLTATALGCRTGVVTSAAAGFSVSQALPGVGVHCVPAAETTTFENIYSAAGRRQVIHAVAEKLQVKDIPGTWQEAAIVHLAPLAQEVDPELVHHFPHSLVCMTPQGWMRCWDKQGNVHPCDWNLADAVLPHTNAVIVSDEDLADKAVLHRFRQVTPVLVMTQGPAGCTVFRGSEARQFPAEVTTENELTGAGDVFAAAFFIHLYQTGGDPWEAAQFANRIAAYSITQSNLEAKFQYIAQQVAMRNIVN